MSTEPKPEPAPAPPPAPPKLEPEPVVEEEKEQMVTIPKKQYDELMRVNDAAYLCMMAAYDKFDDLIGMAMNLNTAVFNKKRELARFYQDINLNVSNKTEE